MREATHLFFDLDRTLWDFETNSKVALQQLYENYALGNYIEHFNHFHHTYVRINADLWRKYGKGKISKTELRDSRFSETLKHHGIHAREMADKISNDYIAISPKQTVLFPNTIETLTELKKMGYAMHIITNGFEEVQYTKLTMSKIRDFFDVIICSETIGLNKPNPAVFWHAMEKAASKPEESVMIGDDREVDILGANQVGMHSVLFDPENQHRIFRGQPKITDLSQLPRVLTGL